MDESWKYYAKWKKPDAKDYILYDTIYITVYKVNIWVTINKSVVDKD